MLNTSRSQSRLRVLLLTLLMLLTLASFTITAFADEPQAAEETAAEAAEETAAEEPEAEEAAEAPEETAKEDDEWKCKACGKTNHGGTRCSVDPDKCKALRPTTTLSIIGIVILVVVIAIGFIKKINLGFMAIGAAFLLGLIANIDGKFIAKSFDGDMFVTLVGVTFLFGMASQNGTLDLFSKKVVALVGKNTVFIPVLMFFLSALISAMGPGHIAAGILMTTFAVYLAFEMKINPITTALFAKLGANAGCASPMSLTGQLGLKLTNKLIDNSDNSDIAARLQFNEWYFFLAVLISGFIFTLLLYVFTKSYKVKADNPLKLKDIPKFNWKQWVTIASIVLMVVLCIGFKFNTGLTAFVLATILLLLKCADEKKAIKAIPWGTLIFICGVGILISTLDMVGAIDMISGLLQSLMGKLGARSAAPIMAASSGILSWVSSTTGVVMPSLFNMLPGIIRNFGTGVSYMELISAITATSFAAAISPLSTGGAIIMSSYSASKETTNEELNKIFKFLFLLSVANVLLNVLLSWLSVFTLGGLFS
jgi:di/tricarboxylate transporter